ncbi:hypothetical protein ABVK25_002259 [Lepraria finkii]|uniref:Uncharacterized protein n=1 Tax=Lepraria finkii TaxID=1340010 RepID=A0ABR4BHB6_9LECA
MTKRDSSSTKHASERPKKGSIRLHDKIMVTSSEASSRKPPQLRTSQKDLAAHNLAIHAGNGTFFSDSPDEATPVDAIKDPRFEPGQNKQRSDGARGPIPSTSKRPPPIEQPNADIAPWMDDGPELSTHGLTSLTNFNTDAPKLQPLSSIRPDTGESEPRDVVWDNEERRPSLASATTESSQTSVSNSISKASTNRGTPYKKVAGFFSDDGRQSSRSSDTSIPATLQREQTSGSKHGSLHHGSRDDRLPPTSPTGSRPLTPLPSSDVTPWLFQDFKEIQQFGDAPVRQAPAGLDKQRYADGEPPPHKHHHSHQPHRLHLPHHRHTRSKEEPPTPPPKDPGNGNLTRPLTHRQDSSSNVRMLKDTISSPMSSRNTLPIRGSSPTPSSSSGVSRSETMPGQWSPANNSSNRKGGLLSKLRRNKGDHDPQGFFSHLPGSTTSLQRAPTNESRGYRSDIYAPKDASRQGSVATFDNGSTTKASDYSVGDAASPISKKESGPSKILHSHGKFPKPKRAFSYDKEAEKARNAFVANESLFSLDTNLDDLTDIVDPNAVALNGPPHGGIFTGEPIPE